MGSEKGERRAGRGGVRWGEQSAIQHLLFVPLFIPLHLRKQTCGTKALKKIKNKTINHPAQRRTSALASASSIFIASSCS